MARGKPQRGRDTRDLGGDQSSSGVGADDRDRQGERVQDEDSAWARGDERSTATKVNVKKGPAAGGAKKTSRDQGDSSSRTGARRGSRATGAKKQKRNKTAQAR